MRGITRIIPSMASIDHLLVLADAYGAATGRSRARVSTLVFNDGKGLDRIAGGADIGVRRCGTAISWFAANWPPETPWPAGVPRPSGPDAPDLVEEGAA